MKIIKKFQNPNGPLLIDMSKAPSKSFSLTQSDPQAARHQKQLQNIRKAAKLVQKKQEKDPLYEQYQKYASTYKNPVSFLAMENYVVAC